MASCLRAREGADEESRRTRFTVFTACALPCAYITGAPGDGETADLGRAALLVAFIFISFSSLTRGATRTSLFIAAVLMKTVFLSMCCHLHGFGDVIFPAIVAQDIVATAIVLRVMVGRQYVVPLTILSAAGPLGTYVAKQLELDIFRSDAPRQLSELSLAEKQEWANQLLAVMLTVMAGVIGITYFELAELRNCMDAAARLLCCCKRRAPRAADGPPAEPEDGTPAAMAEPLPSVTAPTTAYGRSHADAGTDLAEQLEVSHDAGGGRSTPAEPTAVGGSHPGPGGAEAPEGSSSLGLSESLSSFLSRSGGP